MGFTVLRSKAVSHRFVTNNINHHQETTCVQHVNGKFGIHCFGRQYTATFYRLKTWFELSRVKLYINDLRGNKNYFELAGSSSYRG